LVRTKGILSDIAYRRSPS